MRLVTLQMQPRPLTVTVAKATERGVTMTAIDRSWRPEDADRCQLCSVCTVDVDNHCLKLVPWDVPLAEAALFRKG